MPNFDQPRNRVRRTLLGATAASFAVPAVCWSQRAVRARLKLVAICVGTEPSPYGRPRPWWASEFAKHGFVDGKDIDIAIIRAATSRFDDLVLGVGQAVDLGADVIVTFAFYDLAKERLLPLTRSIPLVVLAPDTGSMTVEDLNRSGENLTGVITIEFAMFGKLLQITKELRPGARRVAWVLARWDTPTEVAKSERRRITEMLVVMARRVGLEFLVVEIPEDDHTDAGIRELRKVRADIAIWVGGVERWERLADAGIVGVSIRRAANEGALLSWELTGYLEIVVRLAARVLRGTPASTLPVERVTEFRLAINLRTAQKLGITIPPSILVQAHELFE